jgi:hypothetical protein
MVLEPCDIAAPLGLEMPAIGTLTSVHCPPSARPNTGARSGDSSGQLPRSVEQKTQGGGGAERVEFPSKLPNVTGELRKFMSAAVNVRASYVAVAGVVLAWVSTFTELRSEPDGDSLELQPGSTLEFEFADADLPPTLYTLMRGEAVVPGVSVWLPEDYTPTRLFPLVIYVPGNDGNLRGNPGNARALAGPQGWIAATLPLFKQSIDRDEVSGGVIVSFEDYPIISRAYRVMLSRVFEAIPNIDRERSAMVGFSNGAMTIAVLVSNHDDFVLTHFRKFCLVDAGMFHLTDYHKKRARESHFLILAGDQPDLGRDLKLRRGRLLQDECQLLGVNLAFEVLKNTGHEFDAPQVEVIRTWLRNSGPAGSTNRR